MSKSIEIKKQLIGTEGFSRRDEQVGAHNISYLVRNEEDKDVKNTFVLCHGAACTSFTMQPLANELANTFPNDRVIVIDVPWHGESTSTESIGGKNINDYASIVNAFLLSLIQQKKIDGTFTWLGWSMGGSLGLLAERNGVPINNLVLLCSSAYWGTAGALTGAVPSLLDVNASADTWENIILSEIADVDENVLDVFKENIKSFFSKSEVAVNDLKALTPEHYDLREAISEVSAQTFIFGGSKDALANIELLELLHAKIANSKLVIYDDVHGLVLKPDKVESIVKTIKQHISGGNKK